nr:MAG TPA: hypothetical protein [Caudoviricetes sp.]
MIFHVYLVMVMQLHMKSKIGNIIMVLPHLNLLKNISLM